MNKVLVPLLCGIICTLTAMGRNELVISNTMKNSPINVSFYKNRTAEEKLAFRQKYGKKYAAKHPDEWFLPETLATHVIPPVKSKKDVFIHTIAIPESTTSIGFVYSKTGIMIDSPKEGSLDISFMKA